MHGPVAQLVEQRTFNPRVGGSIPSRLIKRPRRVSGGVFYWQMKGNHPTHFTSIQPRTELMR